MAKAKINIAIRGTVLEKKAELTFDSTAMLLKGKVYLDEFTPNAGITLSGNPFVAAYQMGKPDKETGTTDELTLADFIPDWSFVYADKDKNAAGMGLDLLLRIEIPNFGLPFEPPALEIGRFKFIYANEAIPQAEFAKARPVFEAMSIQLQRIFDKAGPNALNPGMNLSLDLNFYTPGGEQIELSHLLDALLDIGSSMAGIAGSLNSLTEGTTAQNSIPATPRETAPAQTGDGMWIDLNKSLGPLTIGRVGLTYDLGQLSFGIKIDATLQMFGIGFSLIGFGLNVSLGNGFEWNFSLEGLGILIDLKVFTLMGILLYEKWTPPEKPDAEPIDLYSGMLLIRIPELFTLSAIGSYAQIEGSASLMIYGALVLGVPIGKPPVMFKGIAAGFGINRGIVIPELDEIPNYPLVKMAMGQNPSGISLADNVAMVRSLSHYMPPRVGSNFFAFGVFLEFVSMIDAFVLLIVSIGQPTRIDILGVARLKLPPIGGDVLGDDFPILANIEFLLKASLIPEAGILSIEGGFSNNTFILTKDCKVTGRFAFFLWFGNNANSGDFVLSLGGYHPKFAKPAHYPVVSQRIGFEIKLGPVAMEGGGYFAICPTAVMAGGFFRAKFEAGPCWASFEMGFDLLLAWKPFQYDVSFHISLRAGFKKLSAELGVDIRIWGPPLAGNAKVKVVLFSFDIEFGKAKNKAPKPLTWTEFREGFLNASDTATRSLTGGDQLNITQLRPTDGLIADHSTQPDPYMVLHPDELILEAGTQFPITRLSFNGEKVLVDEINTDFGLGSMGITDTSGTSSEFSLTLKDHNGQPVGGMQLDAIKENMPKAIWGKRQKPNPSDREQMVRELVMGLRLTPHTQPWDQTEHAPVSLNTRIESVSSMPEAKVLPWKMAPATETVDESTSEFFIEPQLVSYD